MINNSTDSTEWRSLLMMMIISLRFVIGEWLYVWLCGKRKRKNRRIKCIAIIIAVWSVDDQRMRLLHIILSYGYTVQCCVSGHVVCIDDGLAGREEQRRHEQQQQQPRRRRMRRMLNVLSWLHFSFSLRVQCSFDGTLRTRRRLSILDDRLKKESAF